MSSLMEGVHMASTRPRYPASFRAEAVELARTSSKGLGVLARELGLADQTLRNWLHQAAVEAAMTDYARSRAALRAS